jgi:hypothetical protein
MPFSSELRLHGGGRQPSPLAPARGMGSNVGEGRLSVPAARKNMPAVPDMH